MARIIGIVALALGIVTFLMCMVGMLSCGLNWIMPWLYGPTAFLTIIISIVFFVMNSSEKSKGGAGASPIFGVIAIILAILSLILMGVRTLLSVFLLGL
tara:strand:- start:309 stop:605 length:297 start_codon:yes stop_codon:yes gene_type:complete